MHLTIAHYLIITCFSLHILTNYNILLYPFRWLWNSIKKCWKFIVDSYYNVPEAIINDSEKRDSYIKYRQLENEAHWECDKSYKNAFTKEDILNVKIEMVKKYRRIFKDVSIFTTKENETIEKCKNDMTNIVETFFNELGINVGSSVYIPRKNEMLAKIEKYGETLQNECNISEMIFKAEMKIQSYSYLNIAIQKALLRTFNHSGTTINNISSKMKDKICIIKEKTGEHFTDCLNNDMYEFANFLINEAQNQYIREKQQQNQQSNQIGYGDIIQAKMINNMSSGMGDAVIANKIINNSNGKIGVGTIAQMAIAKNMLK